MSQTMNSLALRTSAILWIVWRNLCAIDGLLGTQLGRWLGEQIVDDPLVASTTRMSLMGKLRGAVAKNHQNHETDS